jgi:hypothetical protein
MYLYWAPLNEGWLLRQRYKWSTVVRHVSLLKNLLTWANSLSYRMAPNERIYISCPAGACVHIPCPLCPLDTISTCKAQRELPTVSVHCSYIRISSSTQGFPEHTSSHGMSQQLLAFYVKYSMPRETMKETPLYQSGRMREATWSMERTTKQMANIYDILFKL